MKLLKHFVIRFARGERGTAAVEFAIVCLPLVLLCVGVVEFGRALNLRNDIAYAADVGARAILVQKNLSQADVDQIVRSAFTGGAEADLQTSFGTEMVGERTFRTLTIAYPLSLMIPGLTTNTLTLSVERRLPM